MTPSCRAAVLLLPLLVVPASRAGDPPKPDKPAAPTGTPAEQYQALEQEYNHAMEKFMQAYRAAKTGAERDKAFKELYPNPATFSPRFLALAEKYPNDPAAGDALIWVVTKHSASPARKQAIKTLLEKHLESPKMTQVTRMLPLVSNEPKDTEVLLRDIIARVKNSETRAAATFSLATLLSRFGEYGKNYGLSKEEAQAKTKEAEKLFEEVIAKYPDAARGSFATQAKAALHGLRHLAVGMVSPEITGTDIDGKPMKLSDFRGKVVVLDFWGHW